MPDRSFNRMTGVEIFYHMTQSGMFGHFPTYKPVLQLANPLWQQHILDTHKDKELWQQHILDTHKDKEWCS